MTLKEVLQSYDRPLNEGTVSGFVSGLVKALAVAIGTLWLMSPQAAQAEARETVNTAIEAGDWKMYEAPKNLKPYEDLMAGLEYRLTDVGREVSKRNGTDGWLEGTEAAKMLRKETLKNLNNTGAQIGMSTKVDDGDYESALRAVEAYEKSSFNSTVSLIKDFQRVTKDHPQLFRIENIQERIDNLNDYFFYILRFATLIEKGNYPNYNNVNKGKAALEYHLSRAWACMDAIDKAIDKFVDAYTVAEPETPAQKTTMEKVVDQIEKTKETLQDGYNKAEKKVEKVIGKSIDKTKIAGKKLGRAFSDTNGDIAGAIEKGKGAAKDTGKKIKDTFIKGAKKVKKML